MEILKFIFEDGYHFFGIVFLILVVSQGIAETIQAFNKNSK